MDLVGLPGEEPLTDGELDTVMLRMSLRAHSGAEADAALVRAEAQSYQDAAVRYAAQIRAEAHAERDRIIADAMREANRLIAAADRAAARDFTTRLADRGAVMQGQLHRCQSVTVF